MSDDDNWGGIGTLLLGGILGFAMGTGKKQLTGWEGFTEAYQKRLNKLYLFKVHLPLGLFHKNRNSYILYREAVHTYGLGFPNSSLPISLRVLEIGCKNKHEDVEKKKPPDSWGLHELLNWGKDLLKEDLELGQGFRMLRNLVHTDRLIQEDTALDAIRYVSGILSDFFPSGSKSIGTVCTYCKNKGTIMLNPGNSYIGFTQSLKCNSCRNAYNHTVIP